MKPAPSFLPFLLIAATTPALAAVDSRELFSQHCAPCHGQDGKARTPAGKKIGAKDLGLSKLPDAEILRQITDGVKAKNGTDRMPAFKDRLSPAEIDALVAFVKTFRPQT